MAVIKPLVIKSGKIEQLASPDQIGVIISSTDNILPRFDGTAGGLQSTGITVDDNNNIVLPTVAAGSATGILYKGSELFLHAYHGSNSAGYNFFAGRSVGNLTMNATSGAVPYEGSYNFGAGSDTLVALTTGYYNFGMGRSVLPLLTSGAANFAIGNFSLQKITTASNNCAIGNYAGEYITSSGNTFVGNNSGIGINATGAVSNNVAVGLNTLKIIRSGGSGGSNNIAIGKDACIALTTGGSNIVIGYLSDTSGATVSNQLNIGNAIYGVGMYGTGKIGINITPTNITALLHLAQGTATAGSAPLKLTEGTNLTTAEKGAVEFSNETLYFTANLRKQIALREYARVTTQFDKTNTTLGSITGLTANVAAGKTYTLKANLFVDASAGGGVKVAIGGTCTATALIAHIKILEDASAAYVTTSRVTALASTATAAGATAYYIQIEGTITVNAAGTLLLSFAQLTASGTSSVLVGSTFEVENII